jgi:hypothetical protein
MRPFSLARRLARPLTSPLDGRIADVNRRVTDVNRRVTETHTSVRDVSVDVHALKVGLAEIAGGLGAYAVTAAESSSFIGIEIRRLQEALDSVVTRLEALEGRGYVERLNHAVDAPLEHMDGAVANLINHATGHRGFAAQAGLWFNPAVTVELEEGNAHLAGVNERIVELPFALGALSRISPPARVLDIGGAESTFSLSAASLGYRVTVVDLHPLPYSHPDLNEVVGRFEDWDPGSERFAAAFLISTIEHFGLGAYGEAPGQKGADRAAVQRVAELLDDEGFLVLTTPYGTATVNALERIYDDERLDALLSGWTVLDRRVVRRKDERTWIADGVDHDTAGVAMVVAAPPRTS